PSAPPCTVTASIPTGTRKTPHEASKEKICPAPETGQFLKLELTSAISAGNAFTGHSKSVSMKATLFNDGVEETSKVFVRSSMGGAFGGYKGACSVLGRCCETMSKDLAAWVKPLVK
ncbi:MAG: hypothetical protein O3C43_04000, partial [Verrucomicrobia bacterium]|nr:hypothetical protein [Verrucomicrobiota bacterium]